MPGHGAAEQCEHQVGLGARLGSNRLGGGEGGEQDQQRPEREWANQSSKRREGSTARQRSITKGMPAVSARARAASSTRPGRSRNNPGRAPMASPATPPP